MNVKNLIRYSSLILLTVIGFLFYVLSDYNIIFYSIFILWF